MSGLQKFIKKVCVQDCVYWETIGNNAYGEPLYDEPAMIKVRWEDEVKVITTNEGTEIVSQAEVLIPMETEVKEQSYIKLSTEAKVLAESGKSNFTDIIPGDVNNVFRIAAIKNIPLIFSSTEKVKTLYLENNDN